MLTEGLIPGSLIDQEPWVTGGKSCFTTVTNQAIAGDAHSVHVLGVKRETRRA